MSMIPKAAEDVWTIYAVGDPVFLHKVLQAVAMLGNDGVFWKLGGIGALLAVMVIGFKIIASGGKQIEFPTLFASLLLFMFVFGKTTTVAVMPVIPDYSQSFRPCATAGCTVENVPVGIAFMGAMITNFGYEITQLMEQAFSEADTDNSNGMTRTSQGSSLQKLAFVRMIGRPDMSFPSGSNSEKHGRDYMLYRQSLIAYMGNCYGSGVKFSTIRPDEIISQPDPLTSIEVNPNKDTATYLNDTGVKEGVKCPVAKERLVAGMAKFSEAVNHSLSAKMMSGEDGNYGEELMEHISSLSGASMQNMQSYVATAAMMNIQQEAMVSGGMNPDMVSAAIMMSQADEQRAVQWAADADFYLTNVKSFVGFIEAVIYALAPIAALIIMLGAAGWKMLMNYVMLGIFVQLQFPLLAITSLYQTLKFENAMHNLFPDGEGMTTIANVGAITSQAIREIAAASSIMAATPALTLAIIYGGAYALSAYTQRLQGADFVNEKMMSPDVAQPAPIATHAAQWSTDSVNGMRRVGAENYGVMVNGAETAAYVTTSSKAEVEQSTNSLKAEISSRYGHNTSAGQNFNHAVDASVTRDTQDLVQQTFSALRAQGVTDADFKNADLTESNAASKFLAFNLTGGLKGGGFGVGVSKGGESSEGVSQNSGVGSTLQKALNNVVGLQGSMGASWREAWATGVKDVASEIASESDSNEDAKAIASAAQEVLSDTNSYQEAASQSQTYGLSQPADALALVRGLQKSPVGQKILEDNDRNYAALMLDENSNIRDRYNHNLARVVDIGGRSANSLEAQRAVKAMTLMDMANVTGSDNYHELRSRAAQDALRAFTFTSGGPPPMHADDNMGRVHAPGMNQEDINTAKSLQAPTPGVAQAKYTQISGSVNGAIDHVNGQVGQSAEESPRMLNSIKPQEEAFRATNLAEARVYWQKYMDEVDPPKPLTHDEEAETWNPTGRHSDVPGANVIWMDQGSQTWDSLSTINQDIHHPTVSDAELEQLRSEAKSNDGPFHFGFGPNSRYVETSNLDSSEISQLNGRIHAMNSPELNTSELEAISRFHGENAPEQIALAKQNVSDMNDYMYQANAYAQLKGHAPESFQNLESDMRSRFGNDFVDGVKRVAHDSEGTWTSGKSNDLQVNKRTLGIISQVRNGTFVPPSHY